MIFNSSCPYVYGESPLIKSFNRCMRISVSPGTDILQLACYNFRNCFINESKSFVE